jgi:hypothetical protein
MLQLFLDLAHFPVRDAEAAEAGPVGVRYGRTKSRRGSPIARYARLMWATAAICSSDASRIAVPR